jgi:hypothetical protein
MTTPTAAAHEQAVACWRPLTRADLTGIDWLVDGLFPLKMFSILEGPPGSAKTTILTHLAYCVTAGVPFAGRDVAKGRIMFLGTEEGWGITALRLFASGVPEKAVGRLEIVKKFAGHKSEEPLLLPGGVEYLDKSLELLNRDVPPVRLIVLDTLSAAIEQDRDQYRESDIRGALMPAVRVAERHGAALLGVRHLTKAGEGQTLSGLGGVAFFSAARAVLRTQVRQDGRYFATVIKSTYSFVMPQFEVFLKTGSVELPSGGVQEVGVVDRIEEIDGNHEAVLSE